MNPESFALPAVILVGLTSIALLLLSDWRLSILALGVQYVGVFLLVELHWPVEMAVTKLLAGWMAGAVLGMAAISLPQGRPETEQDNPLLQPPELAPDPEDLPVQSPAVRLFRLLAAILVGLVVLSGAQELVELVPALQITQAVGGLILIGMGILKLGFTGQPLHTILGLLMALSGFEVLYAGVESSTLVAGMLAAVNLGLALVGAYLLVAPHMEEFE